mmetsp:Transcript_68248/g.204496  ORF Transcript_68248/g.204496 Transcript_68248/m.204496 type:complete len:304 (-) Transcript_68248:843-1754(-)
MRKGLLTCRACALAQDIHLFGGCALPGGGAATDELISCAHHRDAGVASCACQQGLVPHAPVAPGCTRRHAPGQQPSHTWRALPAPHQLMPTSCGAPTSGGIASTAAFFGLPESGEVDVDGATLRLHVMPGTLTSPPLLPCRLPLSSSLVSRLWVRAAGAGHAVEFDWVAVSCRLLGHAPCVCLLCKGARPPVGRGHRQASSRPRHAARRAAPPRRSRVQADTSRERLGVNGAEGGAVASTCRRRQPAASASAASGCLRLRHLQPAASAAAERHQSTRRRCQGRRRSGRRSTRAGALAADPGDD